MICILVQHKSGNNRNIYRDQIRQRENASHLEIFCVSPVLMDARRKVKWSSLRD